MEREFMLDDSRKSQQLFFPTPACLQYYSRYNLHIYDFGCDNNI